MNSWADIIYSILPYLSGGAGGAILTIIVNKSKNRIQVMCCYYIDDDIISKLPITNEQGETLQNIYTKEFLLKNTTNLDIRDFKLLIEFDVEVKILKHTDISKDGVDRLKKRLLKDNEYSVTIRNFNREDGIKFIFEVANVTNDYINITESNCIGFKVIIRDARKKKTPAKLTHVGKEELNASRQQ